MIEEEASLARDRARISRVIHNRLFVTANNPGEPFPLQIDSAVIYGRDRADIDSTCRSADSGRSRPTGTRTCCQSSRSPRSPRRAGRRSRQPSVRHRTRPRMTRSAAVFPNRRTASSSSTCKEERTVRCCSPRPPSNTGPTSSGPGISASSESILRWFAAHGRRPLVMHAHGAKLPHDDPQIRSGPASVGRRLLFSEAGQ